MKFSNVIKQMTEIAMERAPSVGLDLTNAYQIMVRDDGINIWNVHIMMVLYNGKAEVMHFQLMGEVDVNYVTIRERIEEHLTTLYRTLNS